ncbi:hypothetical protein [Paraburkholderia sp.]|uniref:hypothetical protein n=1 Tax=Paraburkholderia sp. TaxID=1926495 RepID=UPI003D6FABFB
MYDWTFAHEDAGLRATHLHIHIARMDVVPDADGALLAALQQGLTYPWLPPRELCERFQSVARDVPALAFIDAFSVPAQPLSTQ